MASGGAYTKIPGSFIAGVVGNTVSTLVGTIASTGHKALDVVEILIADTQQKSSIIKKEIQNIQSVAVQEASELERRAVLATNTVLSDAASTAYETFLNKVTPGRTVAEVSIDISPSVGLLHQQARDLMNRANDRISQLVAENIKLSQGTIRTVDTTLGAVEATLTTVLKVVNTFKAMIKALRAPLAALRAAILIIKAIPLPQRYLIVSFTIIESDLLEMMEQLICQAEEEIRAIEAILETIEATLTPLRDRIRRIRAMLSTMKIDNLFLEASESDLDILNEAGLYDKESRDSIFDKIQNGQCSGNKWECYGNLGGDIDLTDPVVGNQLQLANPGDYIQCPGHTSGSYVEDYYKWQVDKPPVPQGRPEDEGWSKYPDKPSNLLEPDAKLWRLSLLETGEGIIYGGYDGDVVEVPNREWKDLFDTIAKLKSIQAGVNASLKEGGEVEYDPLTGYKYGARVRILGEDNFNQKPGILKPSSWDALEIAALRSLRHLPLTPELQKYLSDLWQVSAAEEAGTSTLVDDAVAYRAANGEVYYLRVIEDEHSPKVAVRRYVQVKDKAGVVILDGIKTFSLNKESLIEEMKLQLDQLTL